MEPFFIMITAVFGAIFAWAAWPAGRKAIQVLVLMGFGIILIGVMAL